MLPILQAPADENDTLATVINYVMAISHHMGRTHTIITADQPLYSKGKELVWTNSKFESVIFLMGGLQICFNFLKSIGPHMESARLGDLWTEIDVYAANTTQTMLDGKVYYRAVRGHPLTYEALATQVANIQVIHQAHSDNPNFKMWSTYISMIEILLDFIRAERDGNWILHLEAFTAMLSWLTIYYHTNYAQWVPA